MACINLTVFDGSNCGLSSSIIYPSKGRQKGIAVVAIRRVFILPSLNIRPMMYENSLNGDMLATMLHKVEIYNRRRCVYLINYRASVVRYISVSHMLI